jgi:hypothetical protein
MGFPLHTVKTKKPAKRWLLKLLIGVIFVKQKYLQYLKTIRLTGLIAQDDFA